MKFRRVLCLLCILPGWIVFAGGNRESPALSSENYPSQNYPLSAAESPPETPVQAALPVQIEAAGIPAERSAAGSRSEMIFRALAEAYPDRTGAIEYLDGDWTIQVYGERFYFAEGRLLPASLRDKANYYAPQTFYGYPAELPPWKPPTPEESARIKEQEVLRRQKPPNRSQHFYDALWRSRSRNESWDRAKQIRFLGHPVLVHYSILTQLSLAEEQILKAAKTSTAVRWWIDNIKSIEGWNWRNISATESRSYHAYGAAIDFLPKSRGGLETYWLWTSRSIPEWWTVPYSRRYQPPEEVIKAFESFGFIWGGKWRYYDTMHFEYRPEILVLSGIARTDLKDLR